MRHAIKVNVPDWGEPKFDPAAFRRQIEDALRDLRARIRRDRGVLVVSINTPEQLLEVVAALDGARADPASLARLHEVTARFRAEHDVRTDTAGVLQNHESAAPSNDTKAARGKVRPIARLLPDSAGW